MGLSTVAITSCLLFYILLRGVVLSIMWPSYRVGIEAYIFSTRPFNHMSWLPEGPKADSH